MLIENRDFQVKHVVKEANQLVDYSANTTFDSETTQAFSAFRQLPSMAKEILNMDRLGVPSL